MGLAKVERERAARGEGALGRAADDEPVFVLRAQDKLAEELVDAWANKAEVRGCSPEKVADARVIAEQMRGWLPRKYPD